MPDKLYDMKEMPNTVFHLTTGKKPYGQATDLYEDARHVVLTPEVLSNSTGNEYNGRDYDLKAAGFLNSPSDATNGYEGPYVAVFHSGLGEDIETATGFDLDNMEMKLEDLALRKLEATEAQK